LSIDEKCQVVAVELEVQGCEAGAGLPSVVAGGDGRSVLKDFFGGKPSTIQTIRYDTNTIVFNLQ